MTREVAGSVVLFVKLTVMIALLGIAVGLTVSSRPVETPDNLPDRVTQSPSPTSLGR